VLLSLFRTVFTAEQHSTIRTGLEFLHGGAI
jgi:hypothetical protein